MRNFNSGKTFEKEWMRHYFDYYQKVSREEWDEVSDKWNRKVNFKVKELGMNNTSIEVFVGNLGKTYWRVFDTNFSEKEFQKILDFKWFDEKNSALKEKLKWCGNFFPDGETSNVKLIEAKYDYSSDGIQFQVKRDLSKNISAKKNIFNEVGVMIDPEIKGKFEVYEMKNMFVPEKDDSEIKHLVWETIEMVLNNELQEISDTLNQKLKIISKKVQTKIDNLETTELRMKWASQKTIEKIARTNPELLLETNYYSNKQK